MDETVSRRTFLAAVAGGITGLAAGRAGAGSDLPAPIPRRPLGRTGVLVPILGAGLDHDIGTKLIVLRQAVRLGVTYWDTAADYANSEAGIGRYFERFPADRKDVFLVTKSTATTASDLHLSLGRSLERLRCDHVDLMLLHSIDSPSEFSTSEVRRFADEAKASGRIRFFGFSTHHAVPCLSAAARSPWIDVALFMFNFRVREDSALLEAIGACHEAGVGLVGMKFRGLGPTHESSAANLAPTRPMRLSDQSRLRVAWQEGRIACMLARLRDVATLRAYVEAALSPQASDQELRDASALAAATRSTWCDGCRRCEEVARVPVADAMRWLMYLRAYREPERARAAFRALPEDVRSRFATADFSGCDRLCPRGVPVARLLSEVSTELDHSRLTVGSR